MADLEEQRKTTPAPSGRRQSADPLLGQDIDGRYRVECVIGEGGMGTIYRALHLGLHKTMALKVLRQSVSQDEQAVARFQQEARAASAIGNPHIAQAIDFARLPNGQIYYVMEYLEGQDLADRLAQRRKIPVQGAIEIALQICDGLSAAHARSIVHRDLKPENIFLVKQGPNTDVVKILDFGIAKAQTLERITVAGEVFGTPHYMSPEQSTGRDVDPRSDIYSLGVLLYEMVTGKLPFNAQHAVAVASMHVHEQPPRPSVLTPSIPDALEDVILKCLAKSPSDRYQSMDQLARDLRRVEDGLEPSILRDSERPVAKLKTTATPLAILLITILLFAFALWWQEHEQHQRSMPAPEMRNLSVEDKASSATQSATESAEPQQLEQVPTTADEERAFIAPEQSAPGTPRAKRAVQKAKPQATENPTSVRKPTPEPTTVDKSKAEDEKLLDPWGQKP